MIKAYLSVVCNDIQQLPISILSFCLLITAQCCWKIQLFTHLILTYLLVEVNLHMWTNRVCIYAFGDLQKKKKCQQHGCFTDDVAYYCILLYPICWSFDHGRCSLMVASFARFFSWRGHLLFKLNVGWQ